MGATMSQKILARTSGQPRVEAGDIVWATPDLVTAPEVSFSAYIRRIREIGATRLAHPDRVAVVIDHEVPVHSQAGADRNILTRKLVRDWSVGHFFDGVGITHPLMVERGLCKPGMLVAGADTHAPGLGAVGALSVPFGFEVAMVLATGEIWMKVPETIRVRLHGACKPGACARDVVLAVMQQVDADTASYRVIEYQGAGLASLSIPERMTICGLTVDAGAKSGIAEVDDACLAYMAERGVTGVTPLSSDDDAAYALTLDVDLSTLAPRVSIPPSPSHVCEASELTDITIQHAYIGSCVSGSIEDLRAAASVLAGRRVHPGVQLLVIPATRQVFDQALADGLLDTLAKAGAQLSPPTCGPCFGGLAQLAEGERRISTSTRNDPGRMGSAKAEIYLASALTVAASALTGHITDPRTLLQGTTS